MSRHCAHRASLLCSNLAHWTHFCTTMDHHDRWSKEDAPSKADKSNRFTIESETRLIRLGVAKKALLLPRTVRWYWCWFRNVVKRWPAVVIVSLTAPDGIGDVGFCVVASPQSVVVVSTAPKQTRPLRNIEIWRRSTNGAYWERLGSAARSVTSYLLMYLCHF